MQYIVRNSIQTPDGTILTSRSRHDFVEYTDANGNYYAVDGGHSYHKVLFTTADFIDLTVYADDDHEVVRAAFEWGTRGKDGKSPVKLVTLDKITDEHLINLIHYVRENSNDYHPAILEIFRNELKYRTDNMVFVPED